jgi:hypothetical protein
MPGTFDGPSHATAFNPIATPEDFSESVRADFLPVAPQALIRMGEVIGGTAGKIVHSGKVVYEKLDSQHRSDMRKIRKAASEIESKSAALSREVSEVSGTVVNYVRTHTASEMAGDLERVAKRYPAGALAIAAAAGFLFERMLLRKSS